MNNLTTAERESMTYLDMLAYDMARKEAMERDTRLPAFLCTSEEAKEKYRQNALKFLNEKARPIVPLDKFSAEKFIKNTLGSAIMDQWLRMEAELKEHREMGNPQAFFA